MKENIKDYAFKLLKKKNYFIKEFYNKLLAKYDVKDVNKVIKEFVLMELINDKYLVEMKTCYFLHIKMYGKNYIINYFLNKEISINLIMFVLSKYKNDIFINNANKIRNELLKKGKIDSYIDNYLLRKGYDEEQIKKYVS